MKASEVLGTWMLNLMAASLRERNVFGADSQTAFSTESLLFCTVPWIPVFASMAPASLVNPSFLPVSKKKKKKRNP